MANSSILAAFERMWQHITIKLADKADTGYVDTEVESAIESLPFETVGGNGTLTWNGDTDGLYSPTDTNWYLVSDIVPTEAELISDANLAVSVDLTVSYNGQTETLNTPAGTTNGSGGFYIGNGCLAFGDMSCVIVFAENYKHGTWTFEKTGIYFGKNAEIQTNSLTIDGYTGFAAKTVLSKEALPEHLQFGETTTTLVDNQTFALDEGMTTLEGVTIEENGTYTVIYNGVEYANLQASSATMEDVTAYFVGNTGLAGGDDNGIPFAVGTVPQQGTILVDVANSESCTVTITGGGIRHLDNKFLEPFDYSEGSDTVSVDVNGLSMGQLIKISGDVLTKEDFANLELIFQSENRTQTVAVSEDTIDGDNTATMASFQYTYDGTSTIVSGIIISTSTAISQDGLTLPDAGVYVYCFSITDSTVTRITLKVLNKKLGGYLKLKPECLPATNEYIKPTLNFNDWAAKIILNGEKTYSDASFGLSSLYDCAVQGGFIICPMIADANNDNYPVSYPTDIDISPIVSNTTDGNSNRTYYATNFIVFGGNRPAVLYTTITTTETTFKCMELALATS